MSRFCVIRTGQTTFQAESRVEPAAGAPLTAHGAEQVQAAATDLATQRIGSIYACKSQGEDQTARLLAGALGVKVRTDGELREIDYGMWQGLMIDEIKRRQPKVYRQWTEDPVTICPPGGETLDQAQGRICQAVKAIVKRHKNGEPLLVLPSVAFELLRCALDQAELATIWQRMKDGLVWSGYEMDEKLL